MTGVAEEIMRVREELAGIESRMTVISGTMTRLSLEMRNLRASKKRLEDWLYCLECQRTTDENLVPRPPTG